MLIIINFRLRVIFPQTLQHALDLVDRNCVTKVVSPSGRELFQVITSD